MCGSNNDKVLVSTSNNIENQITQYSVQIIRDANNLNYLLTWFPTANLLVNGKIRFINQEDISINYNFGIGVLYKKYKQLDTIIGFGFNKIDFAFSESSKWINYFLKNDYYFLKNTVSFNITHITNNSFSLNQLSLYFKRSINTYLDLGCGFRIIGSFNDNSSFFYLVMKYNI